MNIPDLAMYANTLEILDISENRVELISNLKKLTKLQILNLASNSVRRIAEAEQIEVCFSGTPLYEILALLSKIINLSRLIQERDPRY